MLRRAPIRRAPNRDREALAESKNLMALLNST